MKTLGTTSSRFKVLLATSIILFFSCQKENSKDIVDQHPDLLEASKSYFLKELDINAGSKKQTTSGENSNLRQFKGKSPIWEAATFKQTSVGQALVVPLKYTTDNFYLKAGSKKQTLKLEDLSHLMFYRNAENKLNAEVVTWVPDQQFWDDSKNRLNKKFIGKLLVEDWSGNFIKGYEYRKDGSVNLINGISAKAGGFSVAMAPKNCTATDWFTCALTDGKYWECNYDYTEIYCSGSGESGDSGGNSGGSGGGGSSHTGGHHQGGGGTNSNDYRPDITPPAVFTEPELANINFVLNDEPYIADIKKELACLRNFDKAEKYELTLYVDQPVNGKSDQYRIISTLSPPIPTIGNVFTSSNINFEYGHVFVGFRKINIDGSTDQKVLGFYPGEYGPISRGVIKDNSGDPYDVSLTVDVTQEQFIGALNRVESDFNQSQYILTNIGSNEYNCVDAALNWFNASGRSYPYTSIGAFKHTPGEFGQHLRKESSAKKTSGSALMNSQPCK